MTNLAWQDHAVCAGVDEHVFFDRDDGYPQALRFCHACPVQGECLNWALTTGTDHGVYGGTTPDDRAALRRQLGINLRGHTPRTTACGTQYGYQRRRCRCDRCRAAWAAYQTAYRARRRNGIHLRTRRAS